jgi:hypothetical protein
MQAVTTTTTPTCLFFPKEQRNQHWIAVVLPTLLGVSHETIQ